MHSIDSEASLCQSETLFLLVSMASYHSSNIARDLNALAFNDVFCVYMGHFIMSSDHWRLSSVLTTNSALLVQAPSLPLDTLYERGRLWRKEAFDQHATNEADGKHTPDSACT